MAESLRNYFDRKVPVTPARSGPPAPSGADMGWRLAWTQFSKQAFVVLPNQLDRARVARNKFMRAVQ
jgi:hypothetical protein